MADFVYTNAKLKIFNQSANLVTGDPRVMLLMTNTTAAANEDSTNITGLGTLDEMDGAGYSRQALTGEAITADNTNDRAEFDADNVTFSAVSAGSRNVQAALLYMHVDGTAGNDYPLAYIDSGGFPFAANGGDIVISWNAEGILQLT